MKRNIFRFLTFCMLAPVAMLTSCSDMLETDSDLVAFEKDNTLNHPTDSVYSSLGIIGKLQVIADRLVLLGEVRGDLMTPTAEASSDLQRLAAFDFSKENKYNAVSDYYAVINNCNYFLAHIDTAMQRRGRQIFMPEFAAVKSYRAWTYLQLVQAYGQVPLVVTPTMTEQAAREAMNQAPKGIQDICNYFIDDLKDYVGVELPDFGTIDIWDSRQFFIPMRALLGDLCLWAGRYEEAARWYHDYLTDEREPVMMSTSRTFWTSAVEYTTPMPGYSVTSTREIVSFIPMESRVFDGVVSDIPNIMESTRENNYYFQLTPSAAMRQISASQTYCYENKTSTGADTIYVPKVGFLNNTMVGDLRLYANYRESSLGARDPYSEQNSLYQIINKVWSDLVPMYRRTMVYLRYAEALNRAGLPQSAFVVLKYGICEDYLKANVDTLELKQGGDLLTFDPNVFTKDDVIGVHSLGSGDTQANAYYTLPMPASALPTRQDTVDYQIPLVEDMIIEEMALEGAFEGYRFNDLMRVALRRGDPAYLADPISRRNGETDEALRARLMDKANWYLPLPRN